MFNLTVNETSSILMGGKKPAMSLTVLQFVATQAQGATCDDCLAALGLTHESGSVRYYELVRTGCLTPTGKVRRTRSGASAKVHQVSPTADFKKHLTLVGKKTKKPGLSDFEQAILTAGKDFWARWHKAKTKKSREKASVGLVLKIANLRKS